MEFNPSQRLGTIFITCGLQLNVLDMETRKPERNEMITKLILLWNEQRSRELLYLNALKKDKMGTFRRVLSQGHLSAMIFQREIKWIYDYFKCCLTDKDLDGNLYSPQIDPNLQVLDSLEKLEQVASFFKCKEEAILKSYRAVSGLIEWDLDSSKLLKEHREKIREFYDTMVSQEKEIYKMSRVI